MVYSEAQAHFLESEEAAKEQAGREKKCERERDLEDDGGVSQTGTPDRAAEAFAGVAQRVLEVAAASFERRNEPEHEDGPDSNPDGEQ
jgi:hypothetical protein